ncbi:MAG: Holliday junction branch migration protein RuvA [Rickettsiales bacterium]|jgi:Holliday junction DNA helicase RuvA|nr:Holliday junction branch migration protein RuvA [Rickettsiales bacterium]
MIGKLVGSLDSIQDGVLILNVAGVGFRVHCSTRTIDSMPKIGEAVSLFIETVLREDSITLFGFLERNEQLCFNALCRVSGVGNRVAIKIMGTASASDIASAIVNGDREAFCGTPGIGPRLSGRIVTELQNSAVLREICQTRLASHMDDRPNAIDSEITVIRDATNALEGLGYQRSLANGVVTAIVSQNPGLPLESVITESLRKINNFRA